MASLSVLAERGSEGLRFRYRSSGRLGLTCSAPEVASEAGNSCVAHSLNLVCQHGCCGVVVVHRIVGVHRYLEHGGPPEATGSGGEPWVPANSCISRELVPVWYDFGQSAGRRIGRSRPKSAEIVAWRGSSSGGPSTASLRADRPDGQHRPMSTMLRLTRVSSSSGRGTSSDRTGRDFQSTLAHILHESRACSCVAGQHPDLFGMRRELETRLPTLALPWTVLAPLLENARMLPPWQFPDANFAFVVHISKSGDRPCVCLCGHARVPTCART